MHVALESVFAAPKANRSYGRQIFHSVGIPVLLSKRPKTVDLPLRGYGTQVKSAKWAFAAPRTIAQHSEAFFMEFVPTRGDAPIAWIARVVCLFQADGADLL